MVRDEPSDYPHEKNGWFSMTAGGIPALDTECFFITPIGKEGTSERKRSDGILRGVVTHAAGELGLTAVRADQISEPGQITLQVIDHVLGARAAVADLTGLNPNVFYELALRHAARLPVVLIAEKDCILPFDIAQMRTIFFDSTDLESADDCRAAIVTHLREALENEAVDSPIAMSVDVRAMQRGNKVERNVAELVAVVGEMARSQRRIMKQVDRLASRAESAPDIGGELVLIYLRSALEHSRMLLNRMADKDRGKVDTEIEHIDEALKCLQGEKQSVLFCPGPGAMGPAPRVFSGASGVPPSPRVETSA